MERGERIFVCGTRTVIWDHASKVWRVVCATCGRGGTVPHRTKESAIDACVRDSNKSCTCGAA